MHFVLRVASLLRVRMQKFMASCSAGRIRNNNCNNDNKRHTYIYRNVCMFILLLLVLNENICCSHSYLRNIVVKCCVCVSVAWHSWWAKRVWQSWMGGENLWHATASCGRRFPFAFSYFSFHLPRWSCIYAVTAFNVRLWACVCVCVYVLVFLCCGFSLHSPPMLLTVCSTLDLQ